MWHIIISIVIFNTLHPVVANSYNFRPVIYMTDLQKSNVVRNGPESRPMQFKSPKPICGPLPFPNFSCEQRQPTCNYSMQGVLHNNQNQNCNPARRPPPAPGPPPQQGQPPGPVYRVPQYPREPPRNPSYLRENPIRYYSPPPPPPYQHPPNPRPPQRQQQMPPQQQQQYDPRAYGYQNYQNQPPPRYVPGRTTSQPPLYFKGRGYSHYMGESTLSTFHLSYMNDDTTKSKKTRPTSSTTSTWAPNTEQTTFYRNRWGTTSTQAPFPGGMTPSLDTPAQNKCGQFAVCFQPTWKEDRIMTTTEAANLRSKKVDGWKEEMDPDLMKYIMPRH